MSSVFRVLGAAKGWFLAIPLVVMLTIATAAQPFAISPDILYHFEGNVDKSPVTVQHAIMAFGALLLLIALIRYVLATNEEKLQNILFAAGAVAVLITFPLDFVIHELTGVETNTEATLSISHWLLALGFISVFANGYVHYFLYVKGKSMHVLATLSLSLTLSMIGLYYNLVNPLFQKPWFAGPRPLGSIAESAYVLWPIASAIVITFVILMATYVTMSRWRTNGLQYFAIWILPALTTQLTKNNEGMYALIGMAVLTALLLGWVQSKKGWELILGFLIPAFLWGGYIFWEWRAGATFNWGFYTLSAFVGLPLGIGVLLGGGVFLLRRAAGIADGVEEEED